MKQYGVNQEGWPCLLPYCTRREDLDGGFTREDVVGRYYVINQGTLINKNIAEPFILYLRADGTVGGAEVSGTWTLDGEGRYLHLTLGKQEYSGFPARMTDDADTPVTVFTAVGANESVWGVSYGQ